MKEQSHKDEMSAALRGDFQRLRERGVDVALAPSEPEEPPLSNPEVPPAAESELDAAEHDSDADSARSGWLGRLLGG